MSSITIYTDGSCETQTRQGGWAAILTAGTHRKVMSGQVNDTTVNAMELTAVIEGLSALKTVNQTVDIITDSQYVAKGINNWMPDWIARGWKTAGKKPVANVELWQALNDLLAKHTVSVKWVAREGNTEADALAQAARRGEQTPVEQVVTPETKMRTETHVLIAGSRYASREALDYARRVVRRVHELGQTVIVGDNPKGVDMAVVQECRRLKAKVLVVGITNSPRNGGCKHGQYVKVDGDTYRAAKGHLYNQYHARDRWMVDTAQRAVFIWNGTSKGTKAGYDYAQQRGKAAHLITAKQQPQPANPRRERIRSQVKPFSQGVQHA